MCGVTVTRVGTSGEHLADAIQATAQLGRQFLALGTAAMLVAAGMQAGPQAALWAALIIAIALYVMPRYLAVVAPPLYSAQGQSAVEGQVERTGDGVK